MTQRFYSQATAVIFSVIGLVHLARIVLGWQAMIAGWAVPMWASWLAILICLYLAYWGFRLGSSRG